MAVDTFFGAYPEDAIYVFIETMDEVAADAGAVVGIISKYFKSVSVKAIESILGTEPHESFFILQAADDGVVGEAVFDLEMSEIVGLTGGGKGWEGEYGKYDDPGYQSAQS